MILLHWESLTPWANLFPKSSLCPLLKCWSMHSSICHVTTTNAMRQGHLHPPHTLHARPAPTSEEGVSWTSDRWGVCIVLPWCCQCGWQGSHCARWVTGNPFSCVHIVLFVPLSAATILSVRFSLWLILSCSKWLALHLVRGCCSPVECNSAALHPF